jgi:hypothetical protein
MAAEETMQDQTRRAVAYIAYRLIARNNATTVYDEGRSREAHFTGEIGEARVSFYDQRENAHIEGSCKDNVYTLYHYGLKQHIDLTIKRNHFEGFDRDSMAAFVGSVNGGYVSILDHQHAKHFQYTVA